MKKFVLSFFFFGLLFFVVPFSVQAQQPQAEKPAAQTKSEQSFDLSKTVSSSKPLETVVLLTLLSFIPARIPTSIIKPARERTPPLPNGTAAAVSYTDWIRPVAEGDLL